MDALTWSSSSNGLTMPVGIDGVLLELGAELVPVGPLSPRFCNSSSSLIKAGIRSADRFGVEDEFDVPDLMTLTALLIMVNKPLPRTGPGSEPCNTGRKLSASVQDHCKR